MRTQNQKKTAAPQQQTSLLGRSLPANSEAERAILSALLIDDQQVGSVAETLSPNDFYTPANRTVYEAILDMAQARKRIDLVTLQDELTKRGVLDQIGGVVYLITLQEDIPAVGMVEHHAKIVKEKSVLRSLIGSAASIITECYSQDDKEIESVLDHAEKTIFDISNQRTRDGFVQIDIWLKKTFQHLSDIKSHAKGITGVPSGYKKLDEMTSGFQKGDLLVAAGRPSMGKTGVSLCMAQHAALSGFSVGFFSLEMSAEQLVLRLLSSESGIPHHKIRNATISSQEWVELTNVAARLAETNIFIDDSAMMTVMDVRTKARRLKADKGLDFLVIDYLQLLHGSGRHENRHQEVSHISRSLKGLAKELNIPILALSQLSRAVDSRMDKRPMLSDLRESGAIEQDADLIMFLYRDVVYNADAENPALSELIIGKQRNGPTGTVYLNFIRELTKFEDFEDNF